MSEMCWRVKSPYLLLVGECRPLWSGNSSSSTISGMFSTSAVRDNRFSSMLGCSSDVRKTGADIFRSQAFRPWP